MPPLIDILYQDEHLVAVHKPAGMLIHRTDLARDVTDPDQFLVQVLRNQLDTYVYPAHRLDRPTSGVMIIGLRPEVQRDLSMSFEQGKVMKQYRALVRGWTPPTGSIDYAIAESAKHTRQEAVTEYAQSATYELPVPTKRYSTARFSLVDIQPKTGRYHQIRKHMKHISHHLVGDTTHGDGVQNEIFRQFLNSHRMHLYATALQVQHPVSQQMLDISCPMDQGILQQLEPYQAK